MKLYVTKLLTEQKYKIAKRNGCNGFLYNEVSFNITGLKDYFFNATTVRVQSTWYTYEKNREAINNFLGRFEQFNAFGRYDLSLAFRKALYWMNFSNGFLDYYLKKNFQTGQIWKRDDSLVVSRWSCFYQYLILYFKTRIKYKKKFNVDGRRHENVALFISNNFQLSFYKLIIQKLITRPDAIFFITKKVSPNGIDNYDRYADKFVVIEEPPGYSAKMPLINLFKLNKKDLLVLKMMVANWKTFCTNIDIAEFLLQYNLKNLMINEGENGVFGAVICEVMAKYSVKTFNTMNGIKAAQAQDGDVNFDNWFIWDNQMKELLMKECRIPADKLLVTGHLASENLPQHDFNKTDLMLAKQPEDIVISIFSIRGFREEKIEFFNFIYDWIKEKKNIILLIRPHPSEKPEEFMMPEEKISRIKWITYNDKNMVSTYHEQLYLSDLCVVFGSTVSLECRWLKIPCITYEKRERSLIYFVDQKTIYHFRQINEIETFLNNFSKADRSLKIERCSPSDNVLKYFLA